MLDDTFHCSLNPNSPVTSPVYQIKVLPDGDVLVSGLAETLEIVRLHPDGSRYPGLGWFTADWSSPVVCDAQGRVYEVSAFVPYLHRTSAPGDQDCGFGWVPPGPPV